MRYLPYVPLICLLLSGCAGSDHFVQRQGSMEGRINQMMQTQNGTSVQIAELSLQVKELKEQVAKQAAAEKAAAAEIAALQEKVQRLSRRADAEAASAAAARIELVNTDNGGESREEKVQSAYMRAFGLFSANNYDAAAVAFADFIASYPESEDAANARYWLGECHFAAGRYHQAIEAFAKVLETSPSATRGGAALLKTGLSWYGLKENDKGRATLRALLEKYPGSEAAARASEELAHR